MAGAAIYTRISRERDPDREGRGVQIQEEKCRDLAKQMGLEVTDVYVDDDKSAFKGKPRPEWQRMLADLREGRVSTVVSWTNDRLYRYTRDQLDLMEAVAAVGGTIATVKDGQLDPSSSEGRMRMTILASVAEFEVSRRSERTQASTRYRAESGRPNGGRRAFGYQLVDGDYVVDEAEASELVRAVDGILSGQTLTSLVHDLNDRGITTPRGSRWTTTSLARVVRNPTITGRRSHRGETYEAQWPAIISQEDQDVASRFIASHSSGGEQTRGRPAKSLLSGLVTCGECGGKLYKQQDRYVCSVSGGGKGCVSIQTPKLDGHVWMSALEVVERPRAKVKNQGSQEAKKLAKVRLGLLERRDGLSEQFAMDTSDPRGYKVAVRKIDSELSKIESELASLPQPQPTHKFRLLMGTDMTLEERRDYLRAAAKSIRVYKGRGAVADRLKIEWA